MPRAWVQPFGAVRPLLVRVLEQISGAPRVWLRHFEALAPSNRRRYFAWIESAKREETKLRRLKEAIRLLTSGKVLGLK